jgi:transcriptional regulator with XRE-family HTH domain
MMAEAYGEETRLVGRRIAEVRRAAGLTQAELAVRLGWPRDTLINVEHGRRPITITRLTQIAHSLNVPLVTLLIEDTHKAQLVTRLLRGTEEEREQVAFFLDTLVATQA